MTPDEAEATSRLLFHLENQVGFWFALVVGNDPRPRGRLREAAEAWCKNNGRPFFLHALPPERLSALANELAHDAPPGLHWVRLEGSQGFLEQWDAAALQLLLAMNERREAYRHRLDGGIVLEGRESLKRLLRDTAPDLFSIRAFIAEPGRGPPDAPEPPDWSPPPVSMLLVDAKVAADADREIERATRLEVGSLSRLDALYRGVMGLVVAGRGEEALGHANQLVDEFENLLDDTSSAVVSADLGHCYLARGMALDLRGASSVAEPRWRLALVEMHLYLAQALAARGDLSTTMELLRAALETVQGEVIGDPVSEDWQAALCVVNLALGACLDALDSREAPEHWLAALRIAAQHLQSAPTRIEWGIRLNAAIRATSRTEERREGIAILRHALDAAPGSTALLAGLEGAYTSLIESLQSHGDHRGVRRARYQLKQLRKRRP